MLKRILKSIFIIYITISMTFFLIHLLPKNFIDNDDEISETLRITIMKQYNLDKSLKEQYVLYLKNVLKGDLGKSMKYVDKSVNTVIKDNFPVSFELGLYVILFSSTIGLFLATRFTFSKYKNIISVLTSFFVSIPSFVIIGLLQYYIVFIHNNLGIGRISLIGFDKPHQKILPVLSVSLFYIGIIFKIISSKIKEESKKEYVKFLLLKGFNIRYIIKNHILKNILTPLISTLTPLFVSLISGSFVVENLFGINGLGRYFTYSILERDYFMVLGLTIFYTILIIIFFTMMDILIYLLDKRVGDNK